MTLERFGYASPWREKSPALKGALTFIPLFCCLWVGQVSFGVMIFVGMSVATLAFGGASFRQYLRLTLVPMGFLCLAAFTTVVGFSAQPVGVFALPFLGGYLTVTKEGLFQGGALFATSMGCVACLQFFYTTTTLSHMMGLAQKLHCPKVVMELMVMIYRFIFLLLDMTAALSRAQQARLGGQNLVTQFRSTTILASSIFVKTMKRSMDVMNAMEARGYTGEMPYGQTLPKASLKEKIWAIVFLCGLICLTIWWKGGRAGI